MSLYELSIDAEKDLQEVAQYTLHKWGAKQLIRYRNGLKDTFEMIAGEMLHRRVFSKAIPDVFVNKYRYHYIFYIITTKQKILIIAVIHEKRDIVSRLNERLNLSFD